MSNNENPNEPGEFDLPLDEPEVNEGLTEEELIEEMENSFEDDGINDSEGDGQTEPEEPTPELGDEGAEPEEPVIADEGDMVPEEEPTEEPSDVVEEPTEPEEEETNPDVPGDEEEPVEGEPEGEDDLPEDEPEEPGENEGQEETPEPETEEETPEPDPEDGDEPEEIPEPEVPVEPTEPETRDWLAEARVHWGRQPERINWTEETAREYILNGTLPETTVRGTWIEDTTRDDRVNNLYHEEVVDILEGLVSFSRPGLLEEALDSIRTLYRLESDMTLEDIVGLVVNRTEPARLSNGQLVNSNSRPSKTSFSLTYNEIRYMLKGEIETNIREEVLLERLCEYLDIDAPENLEFIKQQAISPEGDSVVNLLVKSKLDEYLIARTAGMVPVQKKVGEAHAILFRYLKRIIDMPQGQFEEAMNQVLDFFYKHQNTILSIRRRFEGWAYVPLSGNELRACEDYFSLLCMACDPVTRNAGIDGSIVRNMVKHLVNEEGAGKLEAFFRTK